MAKRGRKAKYTDDMPAKVFELKSKGYKDYEIWPVLGISRESFYKLKRDKLEFIDAYKKGEAIFLDKIEKKLEESAQGYDYIETTIIEKNFNGQIQTEERKTTKHLPPNQTALIFYLKNKRPDKWSDKKEVEHSGEIKQTVINVQEIDGTEDEDA